MGFSKQEYWGGMPLPSPARDMESVLILIKGALLSFQACVRTFHETPLQLLEKIKNVFNETKNLLKKDWNIFSKNCNNSFAKCSSHGKHGRGQQVWGWGRGSGTEVHWVVGGWWCIRLEGPLGSQPGCYSCAPVCVDVLVLCTYVASCTSEWS